MDGGGFAVGMGAGFGSGMAVGIGIGKKTATDEFEKYIRSNNLRIQSSDGREIPVEDFINIAVNTESNEKKKKIVFAVLAGVLLLGVFVALFVFMH